MSDSSMNVAAINTASNPIDTDEIAENIMAICLRHKAIFISLGMEGISVACHKDNKQFDELIRELRFASGLKIQIEHWPLAQIEQSLKETERKNIPQKLVEKSEPDVEQDDRLDNDSGSPTVQFINDTLRLAIFRRASDIHFEPYEYSFRVRLRIDGVLQEIPGPEFSMTASLCARLKVMAQLNVAERRLPQDGQLTVTVENQRYSMRVASLPTQYGEKIVLRILHLTQQELAIDQLGLSSQDLNCYLTALEKPQGLILVTGPTGSGKTVTLYSGLRYLNSPQRNICSVEDPIEIPVNGINQTQTHLKTELNFAKVLRALLRQDPDVIMVGEIRDGETAEIAVKAAQTGHLVLSTLHTNSTCETLIRLTQMGVKEYHIAASLRLVIAQRLLRKLCPHCRQSPSLITQDSQINITQAWSPVGCHHCFSGYYGRIGIYEMLNITPQLKHALISGSTLNELSKIAREQGQKTLLEAGMALVEQGTTSLEELYRVTGDIPEQ